MKEAEEKEKQKLKEAEEKEQKKLIKEEKKRLAEEVAHIWLFAAFF